MSKTTIGKRNKQAVNMRANGSSTRETARLLGMTETAVDKVVSRHKNGEEVFKSKREWEIPATPDDYEAAYMSRRSIEEYMETQDFQNRIEILKKTIIVGETLKIQCDQRTTSMKVIATYPNVVYGKDDLGIPRSYTYFQLLEFGN